MPYFDIRAYEPGVSTPGNPYHMATIELDHEPKVDDVLRLPFAGNVRVAQILPAREGTRDCPTLWLARIPPKKVEQRVLLKEIQEALTLLIGRQVRGELTHKQFFEAMEVWERCFRDAPEGDYTTEKLLKLAASPYF